MGKAALWLKMLQYLNDGRLYKVSELAELLQTSRRNIVAYKDEINRAFDDSEKLGGPFIENVRGRFGGYRLNQTVLLPTLKLSEDDKNVLVMAYNYIQTKKDFTKKKELLNSFSKIMSRIEMDEPKNDLLVVDKYQLSMKEKDIDERYAFIEKSINTKHSIEMKYFSLKSGEKVHIVDPYKLFIYNNSWFFLAWDHEAGDVWYFKLNRIKDYKMLDSKFAVWKSFKAEDYFDEHGFKNNGDYHHLELIATGTRAMLMKERIYGKNQEINEIDNNIVKVTLDMQNDDAIVSFILGCGDEITVIKPDWLVDRVKKESELIFRKYEK